MKEDLKRLLKKWKKDNEDAEALAKRNHFEPVLRTQFEAVAKTTKEHIRQLEQFVV